MRSKKEINELLERLCEGPAIADFRDELLYEKAAIAAQALAWVLGDEISPEELLEDDED